jgi:hypothetical protein
MAVVCGLGTGKPGGPWRTDVTPTFGRPWTRSAPIDRCRADVQRSADRSSPRMPRPRPLDLRPRARLGMKAFLRVRPLELAALHARAGLGRLGRGGGLLPDRVAVGIDVDLAVLRRHPSRPASLLFGRRQEARRSGSMSSPEVPARLAVGCERQRRGEACGENDPADDHPVRATVSRGANAGSSYACDNIAPTLRFRQGGMPCRHGEIAGRTPRATRQPNG